MSDRSALVRAFTKVIVRRKKRNNNGKDTLNVVKRCRYDMLSHIYQTQCDVPCMLNVDCHVCGLESQNVIELRVNQEYG